MNLGTGYTEGRGTVKPIQLKRWSNYASTNRLCSLPVKDVYKVATIKNKITSRFHFVELFMKKERK